MSDLTGTAGIVAIGAAVLGVLAFVCAVLALARVSRMRRAQAVVVGEHGARDLVAHAAGLQQAFDELHAYVDEGVGNLDERMTRAEARLDLAIAYRSLVRYDAYDELTGHQSTTLALLDIQGNGIVLSVIINRDTARLYAKQVRDGSGDVDLSPEEAEAVRLALAGESDPKILAQ